MPFGIWFKQTLQKKAQGWDKNTSKECKWTFILLYYNKLQN